MDLFRRHPVLGLVFALLVIVGLASWFFGPTPTPPADLVGEWEGQARYLQVEANGGVTYWTKAGQVTTESGGRLARITRDTLTFRVFLIPHHIRVDSFPHQSGGRWVMMVEGEPLVRR